MPYTVTDLVCDHLNIDLVHLLSTKYVVIVSQAPDGKFHIELYEDNPPVP